MKYKWIIIFLKSMNAASQRLAESLRGRGTRVLFELEGNVSLGQAALKLTDGRIAALKVNGALVGDPHFGELVDFNFTRCGVFVGRERVVNVLRQEQSN